MSLFRAPIRFYVPLVFIPLYLLLGRETMRTELPLVGVAALGSTLAGLMLRKLSRRDLLFFGALAVGLLAWALWMTDRIVNVDPSDHGHFTNFQSLETNAYVQPDTIDYLRRFFRDGFHSCYKPPGFSILLGAILIASGKNYLGAVFLNALITIGMAILILREAWLVSCRKAWLLAAAFITGWVLSWPAILGSSSFLLSDPAANLLVLLHLAFLRRGLDHGDDRTVFVSFIPLVPGVFLRPVLLYYPLALVAVLLFTRIRTRNLVKSLGLFYLPVVLYMAFNFHIHSVWMFTSIQAHVLTYYTYGTMIAKERGFDSLLETDPIVARELDELAQTAPPGMTADAIRMTLDKKYAIGKFAEKPLLFLSVLFEGARRLLYPDGEHRYLVLLLVAVALALWRGGTLRPLLVWPVYLTAVYSLEGIGMEPRLTGQVVIPGLYLVCMLAPRAWAASAAPK